LSGEIIETKINKNIMNFSKRAFWIIVALVGISIKSFSQTPPNTLKNFRVVHFLEFDNIEQRYVKIDSVDMGKIIFTEIESVEIVMNETPKQGGKTSIEEQFGVEYADNDAALVIHLVNSAQNKMRLVLKNRDQKKDAR